jgi:soluble lytic murein transglycosylase-like protein
MAAPVLACMALVASFYDLPPRVLPSIQAVEGGRPGVVHSNADGSQDLGVMQVNTLWVPAVSHATRMPLTRARALLLRNACFNVNVAGWILRHYIDEEGGDLMRAIGDYHSHTRLLNASYQDQVLRSADRLFGMAEAGDADRRTK